MLDFVEIWYFYRHSNLTWEFSERPINQKRGSAEPNRFGQFDRRFGRTARPNLVQKWTKILPNLVQKWYTIYRTTKLKIESKFQFPILINSRLSWQNYSKFAWKFQFCSWKWHIFEVRGFDQVDRRFGRTCSARFHQRFGRTVQLGRTLSMM